MSELINGRTPEEIKKRLSCCSKERGCYVCPDVAAGDCSLKLCADALALIEHLEAAHPKWISVKERLPVKQYRVIVRTGHNLVTTGWRSYHVDARGGELWEVDGAHNYHNDVTHWMPLPSAETE